jgi:XTP/dITP diphosphohydrolase
MRILFATSNTNKVLEVGQILSPLNITLDPLSSLETVPAEPIEDGTTFAANAIIKARGYAAATGRRCLAEDSGLVVDALGGAPGVHSARYAELPPGSLGRDEANNRKLLQALEGVPLAERSGRFVCSMAIADPDGRILAESEGFFEGMIAREPRGTNGFGYDPIFWLPELAKTSAELLPDEKNARSHRGAAARCLLDVLQNAVG